MGEREVPGAVDPNADSIPEAPTLEPPSPKPRRRLAAFQRERGMWSGAAMVACIALLAIAIATALPDYKGGARPAR